MFAGGEADQCCGKFSPDGAWIAYVLNESGRSRSVRPAVRPGEAEPIQISKDGGTARAWHTGARELAFPNPENRRMSVSVSMTGRAFKAGPPVALFPISSRITPAMQIRATGDSPYARWATASLSWRTKSIRANPTRSNALLNWTARQ